MINVFNTVTLALNLDKIKRDSQRISKIKPFIVQYNWKDIDFPPIRLEEIRTK